MDDDATGICFVLMPLGIREGLDFDEVYQRAIVPAASAQYFQVVRADLFETFGMIHKPLIERLLGADVVIADISLGTPEVLYQVGIRHAVRQARTVLISSDDHMPFDVALFRTIRYKITDSGLAALDEDLRTALSSAVTVDSPVYEFFPDLSVSLPTSLPARGPADYFRRRLLDLLRRPDTQALQELRDLEDAILREGVQDRDLLTELLYAYRDVSAWDDMVRLAEAFPPDLRQEPVVAQQLALALNRAGDRDGARRELEKLIARGNGDSETYGLLGRIFKDQWRETGDEADLDRAISAYRAGVEQDPADYYPGINLATLLAVKGDAASHAELDELLPGLRRVLDDRRAAGQDDYWQLATSIELAVLAGDLRAAGDLVEPAIARAAGQWMTESTADNLRYLATTNRTEFGPELRAIIDRLGSADKIRGPMR